VLRRKKLLKRIMKARIRIEKGKSWLINTSFPRFVLMEFWFQLQLHCGDHYGVHDGQRDAPDVRVHEGDGGNGGHALFE
jgi:hypothetical protein